MPAVGPVRPAPQIEAEACRPSASRGDSTDMEGAARLLYPGAQVLVATDPALTSDMTRGDRREAVMALAYP